MDSRYDMENYHITKKQLEWLAERVVKLKELTQDKRGHIFSIGILKGSLTKCCHTLNSDYD